MPRKPKPKHYPEHLIDIGHTNISKIHVNKMHEDRVAASKRTTIDYYTDNERFEVSTEDNIKIVYGAKNELTIFGRAFSEYASPWNLVGHGTYSTQGLLRVCNTRVFSHTERPEYVIEALNVAVVQKYLGELKLKILDLPYTSSSKIETTYGRAINTVLKVMDTYSGVFDKGTTYTIEPDSYTQAWTRLGGNKGPGLSNHTFVLLSNTRMNKTTLLRKISWTLQPNSAKDVTDIWVPRIPLEIEIEKDSIKSAREILVETELEREFNYAISEILSQRSTK